MPEYIMPGRNDPAFQKLDAFTRAYIEAALFTNTGGDEGDLGEPSTVSWLQLAAATLARMVIDCAQFQREARPVLAAATHRQNTDIPAQAGYDFWMTREGHGVGFWDGDWSKPAGEQLDKIASKFGTFDLYRGDDGRIHH